MKIFKSKLEVVKGDELLVEIHRSEASSSRSFVVRRFFPMSVLDALLAVGRQEDESLAYRFSCRVGMCGTCLVRVNGKSVLACQEMITPEMRHIAVSPAAGFEVIRDLVVDTTPFWKQWAKVIPYFVPKKDALEPATIKHSSPERLAIDPHVNCIQCGACYSSCGVSSVNNDFLGPAALNRVFVLNSDSRDAAHAERQEIISGEDGYLRCHSMYGCSIACPKELDPVSAIRKLRSGHGDSGGPDE